MISVVCALAATMLVADALVYLVLNNVKGFAVRRDAIVRKWKSEKVFGPEHDTEVSVYRTLKEITKRNLLRDALHLLLFVTLFLLTSC